MRAAVPWIAPLALLAAWAAIARSGIADPRFLPPPGALVVRVVAEFRDEGLAGNLLASLRRDLAGFAIGGGLGVALGLPLGFSPLLQRLFGPLLLVHRQIALFAWIPLLAMWFGGGEMGKVAFIALAAFQPALVNTWQGAAGLPAAWRELAAVLTFSRWDTLWRVALPGALPAIFSGLQAALIYAWTATIGAELLLNVAPGLGGRMNEGQQLFRMDLLLLCVVLTGAVGVTFNLLARRLQSRLLRWRTA